MSEKRQKTGQLKDKISNKTEKVEKQTLQWTL